MRYHFCLLLVLAALVLPSSAVAAKKDEQKQPVLMVDPTAYDFGTIPIGDTADYDFRLSNTGTADLHLFSVTREGSSSFFTIDAGNCPDHLAPKASCGVHVSFAPLAAGSWDAQMVIRSDDPEQPVLAVTLAGATAASGTSAITLQPTGVDFGRVMVGDTAERQLEVVNQGTGELVVLQVAETDSLQPPFSLAENGCAGSRLQAGDSCFLTIHFAPSASGSFQDTFEIVSDDPQYPVLTAEISGEGASVPLPQIRVSPAVVEFPEIGPDETKEVQITIENIGTSDLQIGTLTGPAPPFLLEDSCSESRLAPGQTCLLPVKFSPSEPGSYSDSLVIHSNDPGQSAVTVNLLGTALAAPVTAGPDIRVTDSVVPVSDLNIPFGAIPLGAAKRKVVMISNRGTGELQLGRIGAARPLETPFALEADDCSEKLLQPFGACTLEVTFTPATTGEFSGDFDIPSNDPDASEVLFAVSGSGAEASSDFPAPRLIHPEDGQTNLKDSVLFRWYNCRDMEGHLPLYRLYVSPDPAFSGIRPRVVSNTTLRLGFGAGAILFLLLGYSRRGWKGSRWLLVLLAVTCLAAACSEDIEDSSSTTVGSLESGQTYYWKVVAEYGDGIEATSETRSFSVR